MVDMWNDSKTHFAFCDNMTSLNELFNENLVRLELVKNSLTEADALVPITALALAPVPYVAVADAPVP